MVKSRVCLDIFLEPYMFCKPCVASMTWLYNYFSFSFKHLFNSSPTDPNLVKLRNIFSFQNHHTNTFSSIFFFQELGLSPSVPVHVVLQDWIRHSDGKLSFLGFVRLLHGVSSRAFQRAWNWTVLHVIFPILTFLDLKCLKVTNCKLEFWELP